MQEAVDGKFDFEEEEPNTVECFLQFLYTGDYEDNRRRREPELVQPSEDAVPLVGMSRTFSRRVDYGRLMEAFDRESSSSSISLFPKSAGSMSAKRKSPEGSSSPPCKRQKTSKAVDSEDYLNEFALLTNTQVYIMAEKYDVQPLRALAKTNYEELVNSCWETSAFVTTLRLLHEGTPEGDPLMEIAIKNATHPRHLKELRSNKEFAHLCKEKGDLCFDMLSTSSNMEVTNKSTFRCGDCEFSLKDCKCDGEVGTVEIVKPRRSTRRPSSRSRRGPRSPVYANTATGTQNYTLQSPVYAATTPYFPPQNYGPQAPVYAPTARVESRSRYYQPQAPFFASTSAVNTYSPDPQNYLPQSPVYVDTPLSRQASQSPPYENDGSPYWVPGHWSPDSPAHSESDQPHNATGPPYPPNGPSMDNQNGNASPPYSPANASVEELDHQTGNTSPPYTPVDRPPYSPVEPRGVLYELD